MMMVVPMMMIDDSLALKVDHEVICDDKEEDTEHTKIEMWIQK